MFVLLCTIVMQYDESGLTTDNICIYTVCIDYLM